MAIIGKKICPYCTQSNFSDSAHCIHCGKGLQDAYLLVPDGAKYGIALGEEIKIHGLEFHKAQELASLLNNIRETDE